MLFPTVDFGIFFCLVFTAAWALRGKDLERRIFLTAASYFFYGYWNWAFMALLLVCSLANYALGLAIGTLRRRWARAILLGFSVLLNIGLLCYFKYATFFLTSANAISRFFSLPLSLPIIQVVLPVGISFFTFQAMSYVIDIYRGHAKAERSPLNVLLFISFFPQLVAGPIVRAGDFLPQLHRMPQMEAEAMGRGLFLVCGGLFKKIFIASYLSGLWVDKIFLAPFDYAPLEVLLGVYAYAVVIYCDFSAYSDIAIGTAALLGYDFPDNFNQPYRALSFKDFWRRWHISLSTWLRDYLYIPLGGSRKGRIRGYINLMLTMLLGGLWHGAALKYIFWGLLHGSSLAVERALEDHQKISERKRSSNPALPLLRWVLVFNVVCLGWVFFRAADFRQAFELLAALLPRNSELKILSPFLLGLLGLGMALQFLPQGLAKTAQHWFSRFPALAQGLATGGFLLVLSAVSPEGVAPFIYFQF